MDKALASGARNRGSIPREDTAKKNLKVKKTMRLLKRYVRNAEKTKKPQSSKVKFSESCRRFFCENQFKTLIFVRKSN